MRQGVAHGRLLLAVGAELRPQLDDRGVVAEEAALGEHVRHRGGHTLAHRVGVEGGVRGHRTPGFVVGDARDGVDHLLALLVDGDLQAPLGARLDQLFDGFLDLLLDVVHERLPS
jgi:hypothetical protein